MSPLTLEKTTTPARLSAAPTAARWNQKTVADARDGGERARSGAGGRKRSVARGGALQNDDAVDDGDDCDTLSTTAGRLESVLSILTLLAPVPQQRRLARH